MISFGYRNRRQDLQQAEQREDMHYTFGPTGRVAGNFREVVVEVSGVLSGTTTLDDLNTFGDAFKSVLERVGVIMPRESHVSLLMQRNKQLGVRFFVLATTDRIFNEVLALVEASVVTSTPIAQTWERLCDLPTFVQ